jgi:hypothetical protein
MMLMMFSGFLVAGITHFGLAQEYPEQYYQYYSFRISGYILDSDGNGIAGAMIIFNVPEIVPAVLSDSSGYYEIIAPVGTYHVNVWPPFDSHYISYDEPALAVRSNINKNITLTSGYKISGYITDSSGAPIVKAVVSMDNFFCGWYSKYSGRYFVTAPAGTYTLRARPANGPQDVSDFYPYCEYNVVVNGNLAKNITVETPTSTKSPEPAEPVNPELMAWWKLNEGAGTVVTDSSGNNYQGTIHGASWLNYQDRSSLNFDGASDYVSLPSMDLTNLDSLTVVAWINSDLTEVGFIAYQGNGGEFEMGNGDLGQYTQHLNINSTYASFNVKLSDYNWYRVQSSFPMKPDVWHQIVGVWEKGVSVRVYVDGALAGENDNISAEHLYNPGSSYPSSLGIYSQDQWDQRDFFKGQISNVMVFNKALTLQEINDLYDDVPLPTLPRPTLDVSCKSSASYSGFNVEIEGSLTLNGTAVPDAPILLSYSVNGGKSWEDLTLVYTDSDGCYSATWLPWVTGNYLIKATYEGDVDRLGTSEIVNFAVADFTEKNTLFSVSSNSTVTSLEFNNTTSGISFTVTGPSGTKGYVECAIAKSLVSNAENIKLFLDGSQLNYEITSNADSWLIYVTYAHSSHQISINLPTNTDETQPPSKEYWTWVGEAIIIALICVSPLVYYRKRKHRN